MAALQVVAVAELPRLQAAVDAVLRKQSQQGWVAVGYTAPTTLSLQGSGSGSCAEFLPLLQDDQIQYILVRLPPQGGLSKDALITWIGPRVGKIEQGKKGEHLGDVQRVLRPVHGVLTAFTKQGFTDAKVRALLDPASGSHVIKPSDVAEEHTAMEADAKLRQASIEKFKQGDQPSKHGAGAAKLTGNAGDASKLSALTVSDYANVRSAVVSLLDKATVKGWILLRYTDNAVVCMQASGTGGVAEVLPLLRDDEVQYILLRLPPFEEKVTKDALITWIGPRVGKIAQGKKSEHIQDIQTILGPVHSHLNALTKQSFTDAKVRELLDPAAGTHIIKPTDAREEQVTFYATVETDAQLRQSHVQKAKQESEDKLKQKLGAIKIDESDTQKLSVLTVTGTHAVYAALSALQDKATLQGWLVLRYTAPTTIALQATGPGCVAEVLPNLQDDQIQYVLVRLPASGGALTKDILITWIGPKVSKIEQGKKSEHICDVLQLLHPTHVHLTAYTKVGFTDDKVRALSDPTAGTHIIKADA